MEYIDGGSNSSWAWGGVGSLVANAIWALGKKYITKSMVLSALRATATGVRLVSGAIASAASFSWNLLGAAVPIVINYGG